MTTRPAIPQEIKNSVLVEAGHRCSIPTCRTATPIEIAHIVPWAESQDHSAENLIVLCANCHALQEKGHVSRNALRQYKRNLKILNGRYNDFEKRIFEHIIDRKFILLGPGADIQLSHAIKDGILYICDVNLPLGKTQLSVNTNIGRFKVKGPPFQNQFLVAISTYGEAFVQALREGNLIEDIDPTLPTDSTQGENWRDLFEYEG